MNNPVVSSSSKQTLAMVVAMDKKGLIGADNGLPWRLPDDMQWFVRQTMGKPIIMGRFRSQTRRTWHPHRRPPAEGPPDS